MFVAHACTGNPPGRGRTLPVSSRRPAIRANVAESPPSDLGRILGELRSQLNVGSRVLLSIWLLLMILIPHILRLGDQDTLFLALSLSIMVQVCLVLSLLIPTLKGQETLRIGLLVIALAWLAEFVGHNTGFPFGRYTYTDALWPQIGAVPVQIPVAWLMMLPPAWAAGTAICSKMYSGANSPLWRNRAVSSLTSGLAFTAWDLFLDPQMVAWGIWQWELPGAYFGVPLVNFVGWTTIASLVLFGLSYAIDVKNLPVDGLLVVYTVVWLLNSVGLGLYFDLPGAAAAGFVGMGIFVAGAWRQRLATPR